ncbi:MAG: class I SAM-dependent methyltransferase [Bacteroidales bacterium]|nr:class I SAM-dependent methyltransferase [Bacteroidales bacterium]
MDEESFINFVIEHEGDDPSRLLLSAARWPGVDVRRAARTIEARRKVRLKLPSWHAVPALDYPRSLPLEQCSSEKTALYKRRFAEPGCRIADLTGGLGVDTWALARDAAEAHYCERDAALCAAARHNFPLLGLPQVQVHEGDGLQWLEGQKRDFDLIYLDPARRDKASGRVYDIALCEPNLLEISPLLLSRARRVLAKVSPMADISRTLEQLPATREVHVVEAGGEVKEQLLLMEAAQEGASPAGIHIYSDGITLEFLPEEEYAAEARYAAAPGRYLFQPAKALRKAGCFKLPCRLYGLSKLAPSTHLYTDDSPCPGFPGKTFEVEATFPWGKDTLRQLRASHPRLEMTALNFPLDTEALRRRSGIPQGGDRHLFATTLNDKSKILILCKPCAKTTQK